MVISRKAIIKIDPLLEKYQSDIIKLEKENKALRVDDAVYNLENSGGENPNVISILEKNEALNSELAGYREALEKGMFRWKYLLTAIPAYSKDDVMDTIREIMSDITEALNRNKEG